PDERSPTPPARDCSRPGPPAEGARVRVDRGTELPRLGNDQVAALQREMIAHCEARGDRVALLDAPPRTVPGAVAWRTDGPDSAYAAAYSPWIEVGDPGSMTGEVVEVPPSGHVAGVCGRVDANPGVHKPPAGEVVELAVDTTTPVDDIDHGDLNEVGVNALRA